MALIKISSLGTLASAGNTDVIPIVSGGTTYKITKLAFLTQIQADVDGKLAKSSNLSDLVSASTARDNLGLGSGNSPTFTGLNLSGLTASQLVATDGSNNFQSLSTATYPSLTELSYVKGVTSAIQTQMDLKAPLASPAFTGTPTAPTGAVDLNTTQIATTAWVINQGYQKLAGATTAVASGSISTGNKVVLNSDGTCSVITGVAYSAGTSTSATASGTIGSVHAIYDSVSGKVVVLYQKNAGTTGQGCAVVGTVSGTSISFGSEAQFNGTFTNNIVGCYTGIGSSKVLVAFCNYNTSQQGGIVVGTISGTTISFGSVVAFNAGVATNNISIDWDTGNSKALLVYRSTTTNVYGSVVTVSGTTPTVNTAVSIAGKNGTVCRVRWTQASNVFVVGYYNNTDSRGDANVVTISGTTLSAGTVAQYKSANVSASLSICYGGATTKLIFAYQLASDTSGRAVVGTVSGTDISFGSELTFATGTITGIGIDWDSVNSSAQAGYYDGTNGKAVTISISGTTLTNNTAQTTTASASPYADSVVYVGSSKFVHTQSNSGLKCQVVGAFYTNLTSTNFLGISTSNYTNGQTATITVLGGTDANQSGLTAGVKYYVNDDGTLGTTNTQPFVGLALTSTRILVKG